MTFQKHRLAAAIESIGQRIHPRSTATPIGACVLLAASMGAAAQTAPTAPTPPATPATLPVVEVTGFRGTQVDSPRYTRELIDIPRIITVLPNELLQEQNVISLREALRNNIPGISLQAGEGNPPGGDQLKIRGVNARDDLKVNGVRNVGNYFRDPFFVEQVEVIKGPNSAFSGRGSAGGTVNLVTKQPQREAFLRAEGSVGSSDHYRATLDFNHPIDSRSGVRLNVLTHQADLPGRDIAEEKRLGVHAAVTWGFTERTTLSADLLHLRQNDIPDAGLPFDRDPPGANALGTGKLPPGLDFDNFYGHVDDYRDVDVTELGLKLEHRFGNGVLLSNRTRLGRVDNDSITSSPRIRNIQPGFVGSQARGDTKPRDQKDEAFTSQTDVLFSFNTGWASHDLVTGVEVGRYTYENRRRPDVSGPSTDLYDPAPRNRPATPYDGTTYSYKTKELAFYLLDTVKLTPQFEINGGVRWDRVEARAMEQGRTGENRDLERTDSEVSYSIGLVYKLKPTLSLYAAFGSAFTISGNFDRNQVQLAGGATARIADPVTFDTPPEKTRAYEAGVKWRLASGLDLNAAVFRTATSNGRFPGQGGGDPSILDTKYQIDGVELLAAGTVARGWNVYAGYALLDSEVKASPSRPFAVGQELGGTPKHSFNVFTLYDVTTRLTLGGGVQYADEQTSNVQASPTGTLRVSVPSYTVFDVYAAYRFTPNLQLRLNVHNVGDKRYISQLAEGGGQGIPGPGRQAVLTLRYRL